MRQRIAIDMDEVMADLVSKHLNLYNKDYNETLTLDDLQGIKLRELRPHLIEEIRNYLRDPSFFRDLEVMKDSQEVIQELSEHYDVFITTAAMEYPTSFEAKYEWLKEHFPFLNDQHFVFCGSKSIIQADYLIDDNVRQLKQFLGKGVIFTAPHNINITGYDRVNNWKEVRDYFIK